ncbi:MAG: sigma-70 family RNA polymerase sigma factor [Cytophagaceae bacterium]|nr:sigma-70 family RNA polymerase sigma factor [Cytophagaceae bacterium]
MALSDDPIIWQQFREGDEEAFATIYRQHVQTLFRYGMSLQADGDFIQDCIHDVFVEIWIKRQRVGDTDSIKYYLIKSLKNRIFNQLGRQQRQPPAGEFGTDVAALSTPSYEEEWIRGEDEHVLLERLARYLDRLPPRQREALQLRFFEDLDYQQVADILSVNQQSAYNLIFRALEELRRHLLSGLLGAFLGLFCEIV